MNFRELDENNKILIVIVMENARFPIPIKFDVHTSGIITTKNHTQSETNVISPLVSHSAPGEREPVSCPRSSRAW